MNKWGALLLVSLFAAGIMSLVGGFTLSHGFERHNAPHPVISTTIQFETPPAIPSQPVVPQGHPKSHVNVYRVYRTVHLLTHP